MHLLAGFLEYVYSGDEGERGGSISDGTVIISDL